MGLSPGLVAWAARRRCSHGPGLSWRQKAPMRSRTGCPGGSCRGGSRVLPAAPQPAALSCCKPRSLSSYRTKSVSSMSEFESLLDCSPYLPGKTGPGLGDHSRGKKASTAAQLLPNGIRDSAGVPPSNCTYVNNEQPVPDSLAEEKLGISSWDYSRASSLSRHDTAQKQMQRSYTAPDKTGIRIYYSPPVVRRLETPLVHNKEGKIMIEPGFLFTMAKPKELEESASAESTYSQWLCNFSKQQRELLDGSTVESTVPPVPRFPPSLHDLEISGNMSDDMKEITNCVRQAIRSSSLERKVKSASSQTVGLAHVGTQTIQTVSIGLQTDLPRGSGVHSKSWSPRSSSLVSVRSKQISSSLDKVHSRIERPCCSPKYGSPKLQRRSSSKLDASKDRSLWNLHQSKQNGSAWARSTTTRDSPVLSNINDGLSSLFSVVEHAGSTESIWKPGCPESSRAKPEAPKYGLVQEFFRNVCGRAQSPTAPPEKKEPTGEEGSKRAEHPSPATHHPAENISRILNKKVLKQSSCEDPKPSSPGQGSKDAALRDPDLISAIASEVTRQGAPRGVPSWQGMECPTILTPLCPVCLCRTRRVTAAPSPSPPASPGRPAPPSAIPPPSANCTPWTPPGRRRSRGPRVSEDGGPGDAACLLSTLLPEERPR